MLNNDHIDPTEYLEYVQSGAIYNDPDYCMSYSLKEKEVNKDETIFGKMAMQVLAESLLARGIARYFPDNGMVKGETELARSLYHLSIMTESRPVKDPTLRGHGLDSSDPQQRCKPQMISGACTTDIQKYCLNWRGEAVELFSTALDRIYGLEDFFGWHCKRQKTSKVYVVDAFCPE